VNRLSAIQDVTPQFIATATLAINTTGPGFVEFTRDAARFLTEAGAGRVCRFPADLCIAQIRMPIDIQTSHRADRLAP
jgi:hypothetical protein